MRNIEINFVGQIIEAAEDVRSVAGFLSANFVVRHVPTFYNAEKEQWSNGEENDLNCIAWKDLAEKIVDRFAVGDYVMVSGEFRTRRLYDADDNVIDAIEEVVVRDIGKSTVYS